MKKKILFILSTLIIASMLLSACAPTATATAVVPGETAVPGDTAVAPTGTVEISYGLWDQNQLAAHEQIIAAFEAQNPNIKVTPEVVPWGDYWTKLQTAVAGGAANDVFWMNRSEERRVGKSVDLGGSGIVKKKQIGCG